MRGRLTLPVASAFIAFPNKRLHIVITAIRADSASYQAELAIQAG